MVHDEVLDSIFTTSTLFKSSILVIALLEFKIILEQREKITSFGELLTDIESNYKKLLERANISDEEKEDIKSKLEKISAIKRSE